jgi:hypothetical protein
MIAELWEDMIGKFVIIFIGILLIGLSIFLLELHFNETTEMHGVVIDKMYTPSHTSTGTGYVATSKGGGMVVTTSYEPEKYEVIVKSGDHAYKVTMSLDNYYQLKVGDETKFWQVTGSISGINYGYFKIDNHAHRTKTHRPHDHHRVRR